MKLYAIMQKLSSSMQCLDSLFLLRFGANETDIPRAIPIAGSFGIGYLGRIVSILQVRQIHEET